MSSCAASSASPNRVRTMLCAADSCSSAFSYHHCLSIFILFFVVQCVLFIVHCLLSVVCCLLLSVHCLVFIVYCLLFIVERWVCIMAQPLAHPPTAFAPYFALLTPAAQRVYFISSYSLFHHYRFFLLHSLLIGYVVFLNLYCLWCIVCCWLLVFIIYLLYL